MRRTEWVVFAFGTLGESRQSAALTDCANAVTAAGEDFVRVALVSDVPYQPVARRIKNVVQRDRQFDNAEPSTEMAASFGDCVDGLVAQFVRYLFQLLG